ncbi:MAG: hypothetical protein KC549_13955, partial [Myxococcales bacterium]|nr:hypothetical protein [Myxococcales bacterium]
MLALCWAGMASAAPGAAAVPWVSAAPRVPHDIVAGRNTRLKFAEIPAAEGGALTAVRYNIEYGDGQQTGFQNIAVGASRAIEATHAYQGAVGTPYT